MKLPSYSEAPHALVPVVNLSGSHEEAAPSHPTYQLQHGVPWLVSGGQQGWHGEELFLAFTVLRPPVLVCPLIGAPTLNLWSWGDGNASGTLEDHHPFRGWRA